MPHEQALSRAAKSRPATRGSHRELVGPLQIVEQEQRAGCSAKAASVSRAPSSSRRRAAWAGSRAARGSRRRRAARASVGSKAASTCARAPRSRSVACGPLVAAAIGDGAQERAERVERRRLAVAALDSRRADGHALAGRPRAGRASSRGAPPRRRGSVLPTPLSPPTHDAAARAPRAARRGALEDASSAPRPDERRAIEVGARGLVARRVRRRRAPRAASAAATSSACPMRVARLASPAGRARAHRGAAARRPRRLEGGSGGASRCCCDHLAGAVAVEGRPRRSTSS